MRVKIIRSWLGACGLSLTACAGAAPAGASAITPPPAPESPVAPSTPKPSTTVDVAPAAQTVPSPFHVVGELPGDLVIYSAGERGFVADQAKLLLDLVGDDVRHETSAVRELNGDSMYELSGIAGSWPDAVWMTTTHPSGRSGYTQLWHLSKGGWVRAQRTPEGQFLVGLQPWSEGRFLAAVEGSMVFDAQFWSSPAGQNALRPVTAAGPVFTKAPHSQWFCKTLTRVDAFAALTSGHIFVLGTRCQEDEAESHSLSFERWAPGAKHGTVSQLPDVPGVIIGLVALSPTDVYLATDGGPHRGSNYFARFDGTRWTEMPLPTRTQITSLSSIEGKTLLLQDSQHTLWLRAPDQTWKSLALPSALTKDVERVELRSVWAKTPDDIWAIAKLKRPGETPVHSNYLLHTRPARGPIPTLEEVDRHDRKLRAPTPPNEWCQTSFTLLYTLGRQAPPDYDYPATRAALRGHPEFAEAKFVEFERDGRRYFGARVPDFDIGKKLAALVKNKVPGSTPALVCHDPEPSRTFTIDFSPAKPVAKANP